MTQPNRSLPPNVVEALRRGDKIEAIKLLREATRVGLAEAKAAVDRHGAGGAAPQKHAAPHPVHSSPHPWKPGGLSPGEMPRTSYGAVAIAIFIAIAAFVAWRYFNAG